MEKVAPIPDRVYQGLFALSNINRLMILRRIKEGTGNSPRDFIWAVSSPLSISHHLKVLRESGLVAVNDEGEYVLVRSTIQAVVEFIGGLL